MNPDLLYKIGITLIPGIGVVHAKNLIARCGGARAVFSEKKAALLKIPGVGVKITAGIARQEVLHRAEQEMRFIEKNDIKPLYFLDDSYPRRLKLCGDGPVLLFMKGKADLNQHQILAMVGSRNATEYGRGFCEKFVKEVEPYKPLIISGLAYGIDVCSHKAALACNLPTVAVLGHGLDKVYPARHKATAERMTGNGGGLLSEFISGTRPDRENFPKRNRIIAGISDAVIVVEAARKGGALITAEIANSYNRDVFAVPGRLNDPFSEGCNYLIKTNKAAIIDSAEDLHYLLGWEKRSGAAEVQKRLFVELDAAEQCICDILLKSPGKTDLDILCHQAGLPVSKVLVILMGLEIKGVVRPYPGRQYGLV